MSEPVKRLPLATLELWKRKAAAFDEVLAYLKGWCDTEREMVAYNMLQKALRDQGSERPTASRDALRRGRTA
jgi:hypothetical protein